MPYAAALARQRAARAALLAGGGEELLALLEHAPVVTVGRRPAPGVPSRARLAASGIDFARCERGGLATWHGPGQLVGYLVVDAGARGFGPRALVAALEGALIGWLRERGVAAVRRPRHRGVWVGNDKIAAIGLHFRRGVTLHGFALNLDPDLAAFDLIVPCGIVDGGVTSLARCAGWAPAPREAAPGVAARVREALRAAP